MRFFSNENKESNDESSNVDVQSRAEQENAEQAHDDVPDHVQSEPVAVPQQRTGSPWSDAPGRAGDDTSDAELAARERADGTDEAGEEGVTFHEPAPQPTAFGASTVGGAVAASAMANEENDRWDATDRDSAADSGVGDDRSVAPGDGLVTEDTGDDLQGAHRAADADADTRNADGVDAALEDRGTFDDPRVTDAATDETQDADLAASTTTYRPDGTVATDEDRDGTGLGTDADTGLGTDAGTDTDSDRIEGEPALKDEGGFDDPKAVDPATDRPLEGGGDVTEAAATGTAATGAVAAAGMDGRDGTGGRADTTEGGTDGATVADASAPIVPIPVGTGTDATTAAGDTSTAAPSGDRLPGTVTEPDLSNIFAPDDAQAFHERWRDVQLRFVDSPKDATTEAANLLDEAVDKLATSLKAQKDRLRNENSDDTEQLRVELRGYRDILNRVLGL